MHHFDLAQRKYKHLVCVHKFLKNGFPLYQEKYMFWIVSSLMILMRLYVEVHLNKSNSTELVSFV